MRKTPPRAQNLGRPTAAMAGDRPESPARDGKGHGVNDAAPGRRVSKRIVVSRSDEA